MSYYENQNLFDCGKVRELHKVRLGLNLRKLSDFTNVKYIILPTLKSLNFLNL